MYRFIILGLAIIPIIFVPVITVGSYATDSFFPCLPCHTGKLGYEIKPEIVTEEEKCIEPVEYMRVNHSYLLTEWKETVVRGGNRTYVATDGKEYNISLIGTCLDCHPNKQEFCDSCHNNVVVWWPKKLGCWDCHTLPPEEE